MVSEVVPLDMALLSFYMLSIVTIQLSVTIRLQFAVQIVYWGILTCEVFPCVETESPV